MDEYIFVVDECIFLIEISMRKAVDDYIFLGGWVSLCSQRNFYEKNVDEYIFCVDEFIFPHW